MDEKFVKLIANKNGYEKTSMKCIEELSELIQIICKDKKKRTTNSYNSAIIVPVNKENETGKLIVEKIADVEIVLEQLKVLVNCNDEVEKDKDVKLSKQLENLGLK